MGFNFLYEENTMNLKEILEINPVLYTQIVGGIIGVCGALGVKELLAKAYDRWCAKSDEEDTDHKMLMEIVEKLDKIEERLVQIEANDQEGLENDIIILEHEIFFMQQKAIAFQRVSKDCMPQYRRLYRRYKTLLQKADMPENEEVETNNEIVERMFHDGQVVENFWGMKK